MVVDLLISQFSGLTWNELSLKAVFPYDFASCTRVSVPLLDVRAAFLASMYNKDVRKPEPVSARCIVLLLGASSHPRANACCGFYKLTVRVRCIWQNIWSKNENGMDAAGISLEGIEKERKRDAEELVSPPQPLQSP